MHSAPWVTWDKDMSTYPAARWVAQHAGNAQTPLRTSHFASQIAAAQAGLGLALLPAPYAKLRRLVSARTTKELAATSQEWPRSELWLVGHRVLRDVPRVAVVWSFLAAEMRALQGR
jgi:DNA-binding transcriptional LysR family regulator